MVLGMLAALQRDAAMRGLFKNGSATSRDILTIEFGHWPPNGLDFRDKNRLDRTVQLKSHFQDKSSGFLSKALMTVGALGYVHGKEQLVGSSMARAPKDEAIFMNNILLGPVGKLAAAFVTYSLMRSFMKDLSIMGMTNFISDHILLSAMVLGSSLRHTPLTQLAMMPFHSYTDTAGHEHIHILQVHDGKRAKTGFDMEKDTFKKYVRDVQDDTFSGGQKFLRTMDNILSLGSTKYLMNDVEVQARLHTAIVHGYHRWGRLPETKHEFWAACIDAGLNAPKVIRDDVANSTEDGVKDFMKPGLTGAFMRVARKVTSMETAELNAAQRTIRNPDLTQQHWDRTLPFMYGHLLELYGDPTGRAKMGFTKQLEDDGMPMEKMTIIPPPKGYKPTPFPSPRPPMEAPIHRAA